MPKGIYKRTKSVWNKGTKGVMKPNKTSFKKGQHNSPKTEFKKGHKLSLGSEIKRRENISLALIGKTLSKKHCENMSKGMKNPSKEIKEKRVRNRMKKGWFKNLKETKKKMSESNHCYWKDKQFSEDHIKNLKKSHIKYYKEHPEEIERLKEQRAKIVLPVKDTSIEVKIQQFLKTLGIEYFTHQYMKIEHGYQCDVLIPSMNLVIECDGDYWHKYPIGREIDHIRTKELIEKGFKVLRLWEFEIREITLDDFEDRIKTFK